jgi:protoporphyrinogen oxidase
MAIRHIGARHVILGGGLAGMAAALPLGDSAVVLEAADRPGGLVRSHHFDGYWFDAVLHLLHVGDEATLTRIKSWLGDVLQPLQRVAWIEMEFGRVRYPFQQNLFALPPGLAADCLIDMARVTFAREVEERPTDSFRQRLLHRFGQGLCEMFFFPYNEKIWKRSLDSLPASGFAWTIPSPDFRQVLHGALAKQVDDASYNSNSWYPVPPADAPLRGMEVLSAAMASRLSRLETRCVVRQIDPDAKLVTAATPDGFVHCTWEQSALSTLPLPLLAEMTLGLPDSLRQAARQLRHMRVIYLAFCIRGPRPHDRDHWHYYPDPQVSFSRLVYMHRFDPLSSPPDGWGLMAEITERADEPSGDRQALLNRVAAEFETAGVLPGDCRIVGSHVIESEYGYVVFDDAREEAVSRLQTYYLDKGISLLGRFGRWDYNSMSQVLNQGLDWARATLGREGNVLVE